LEDSFLILQFEPGQQEFEFLCLGWHVPACRTNPGSYKTDRTKLV